MYTLRAASSEVGLARAMTANPEGLPGAENRTQGETVDSLLPSVLLACGVSMMAAVCRYDWCGSVRGSDRRLVTAESRKGTAGAHILASALGMSSVR